MCCSTEALLRGVENRGDVVMLAVRGQRWGSRTKKLPSAPRSTNVAALRVTLALDWAMRENLRAQMRVLVKRILRKYGYPPDKQEKATQTVLEQAEVLLAA